jgi:aminoglycoside 6-adenylyltransferase
MTFLDKVLEVAKNNDSVRLVVMNGSRVNPNIIPDGYQDYDIVFYVDNYQEFIKDLSFVGKYGEILVEQTTKDQRDGFETIKNSFVYMAQYKDGKRLDLTVRDIKFALEDFENDSLSKVLLDKEGLNLISNPNESSYYVKEINQKDFDFCVNEFYWVCPYIAKGVKRGQLFYAIKHLDIIREELEIMIDWWIAKKNNYMISVGKCKSRYIELLPMDLYNHYVSTYPKLTEKEILKSLDNSIILFDYLANYLSKEYDFDYYQDLKAKMMNFIKKTYK